jgi:hypothetical protein
LDKETIFYSSLTNTYHKASFPDGVTGQGTTSDYLAFLNKSSGSYFFDANDGSLISLSYPMHIDGLSNSAAVTYDDNTNTGYGYNSSTKTWTQTPITGNLNLPPRIVEFIGIVPVDSRKGYYIYSAKHNYWGYLYSNDYKSEFVGENIACVRNHTNKTLYAFYPDAVIGVNEETSNSKTLDYKLYQNFPNPFNPSTTIRFELPSSGLVTLKIYDVLGNEVVTLVNEEKRAGDYEVEFSAKGGSLPAGRHGAPGGNTHNLSSGIYFYQLLVSALQSKDGKAGNYIETRKMLLLK